MSSVLFVTDDDNLPFRHVFQNVPIPQIMSYIQSQICIRKYYKHFMQFTQKK